MGPFCWNWEVVVSQDLSTFLPSLFLCKSAPTANFSVTCWLPMRTFIVVRNEAGSSDERRIFCETAFITTCLFPLTKPIVSFHFSPHVGSVSSNLYSIADGNIFRQGGCWCLTAAMPLGRWNLIRNWTWAHLISSGWDPQTPVLIRPIYLKVISFTT